VALVDFAKQSRYEETVAALSSLCAVPIGCGPSDGRRPSRSRAHPVQVGGLGLADGQAIITSRPGGHGTSNQGLDTAYANFERLSPTTAQRVMRFWQVRRTDDGR